MTLLNKIDLLRPVDFDIECVLASARGVNPAIEAVRVQAKTGEGIDGWYQWLEQRVAYGVDLAFTDESTSAMLSSILLFGFVIGMRHAIEADHLAAVSVLVSRKRRGREMIRHGAIWGLGHTLALGLISSIVLFSPWVLPETFGPVFELLVGLLLVILGVHLLYRLWRDRVHIHEPGQHHLHAHSHRDEPASHAESQHEHDHASWNWRTLAVGLAHGAAGSAAVTVYVAASLESPVAGILYVLLFGLGSILGMVALTMAIAVPLRATATRLTWANRGLHSVIGLVSIALGVRLAIAQSEVLWSWAG